MANQQAAPRDAKRNAQPVLQSGATGEQKSLIKNPFKFDDLRFPLDVGNNDRHLHWIKFIPCIQEKSSYQVKTQNVLSFADTNRAAGSGAGSRDLFTASQAAGTTVALGGLVAAEGLFENAGDIGAAIAGVDAKAAGRLAGEAAAGALGVAAAGVIVGAIDLSRKTRRAAATISLYMPDTLMFTNSQTYEQLTPGNDIFGQLAVAAGQSLVGSNRDAINDLVKSAGRLKLQQALGGLGSTGQLGLFAATGTVVNPMLEMIFKAL
ncbi:MAG: hypothetical protein EBV15_05365 [Bacteroidetes bacterium]|nr:hypothetical protein [Bacteroidota bacterium]